MTAKTAGNAAARRRSSRRTSGASREGQEDGHRDGYQHLAGKVQGRDRRQNGEDDD